jgi:hypothetical protein
MPSAEKIVVLIRTALLTLNDALATGNFTVLRDSGAPSFRDANNAHALSRVFDKLIARRVDLSAAAVSVPELVDPPNIDARTGLLQLHGRFASNDLNAEFLIRFQNIAGAWKLFGLSIDPRQPETHADAAR